MAEANPSTTALAIERAVAASFRPVVKARVAELTRRMGWLVTDHGGDAHRQADELLAQACRLLPGGEELALLFERVPKWYPNEEDY